jgi:hypothetical protein
MDTFFSFAPAYSFDLDPEFPGSGEWDCRVFNYGRDGKITPELESRWGTPIVVRVEPTTEAEWVGMFASGGLGGVRTTSPCPSPPCSASLPMAWRTSLT